MKNPYDLYDGMPTAVWLEWQQMWRMNPWGGERGDLQAGIVAQAVYRAMYGAVNRVIQAIAGGSDDFDYENLPTVTDFMPYYRKRKGGDAEGDEAADEAADDGKPLDPNTMTAEQWRRHELEISQWRQYLAVRMAAMQMPAPGELSEAQVYA